MTSDGRTAVDLLESWARELGPRLYRAARYLTGDAHEAEEVCQETFTIALEADFRGESQPYTWLYGILRNVLRARRRKRRPAFRDELPEDAKGRGAPPEEPPGLAVAAEEAARVRAEVLALPEDLRDVVLLHYLEELPVVEIARSLEIPEGTVKSRLYSARARLRERLEGETP